MTSFFPPGGTVRNGGVQGFVRHQFLPLRHQVTSWMKWNLGIYETLLTELATSTGRKN